MALPWPDHLLTLEEWDTLPEDNSRRYELVEGVMVVSPRPVPRHQYFCANLAAVLNRQLERAWVAVTDVELTVKPMSPPIVRAPDLLVAPADVLTSASARVAADGVCLVVEVISPGSRSTDRVLKPLEYADAGISHYWIVDLQAPVSVSVYTLIGGEYELSTETSGILTVEEPFPLTVDLGSLLQR